MKKAMSMGMIISRPTTITATMAMRPSNSIDRLTVSGKLLVIYRLSDGGLTALYQKCFDQVKLVKFCIEIN